MRKTLLAVTWGILLLFSADHAFAEHFRCHFRSFVRLKTSTALALRLRMDQPNLRPKKRQAKPTRSAEDVALSERLQDLIANKLQQYVARLQDRTAIEAFYRGRDFAPLWVNAGGPLPAHNKVSTSCMVSLLMVLIPRITRRPPLLIVVQSGWRRMSLP